jgi:hypothetical protein
VSAFSPPPVLVPSTLWVPERRGSYGPVVIDFADDIGIPMDTEQRRDIDALCSFGAKGRWLTLESGIVEGRQNGKTKSVLLAVTLADLFQFSDEPDRIVWTAHVMKTALDTFDTVKKLIDANPILSSRVKQIVDAPSKEQVILMNGATLDFIARVSGTGRGLSGKRLIYDEALFLKASDVGTTLPVLSSRDNPQVMYGSSAGKMDSDHLRSLQRRGRRGGDPSLIWIEYRAPGGWDNPGCARSTKCDHIYENPLNLVIQPNGIVAGCAMDIEENWMQANHAIHRGRMRLEFTRAERRSLCQTPAGVIEFGRERMGWEELGGETLDPDRIPKWAWDNAADPMSEIVGPVMFSIDMPPAGDACSIGVAGFREDGSIHFGVIDYRRGSDWAVRRLVELAGKHEMMAPPIWQPKGTAVGSLQSEIDGRDGLNMTTITGEDMTRFCGAFKTHLTNDPPTARHRGTGVLDTAFTSAERLVTSQGGWVWGRRKGGSDISPVVAVTEAVGGVDTYGESDPGVWSF